MKRLTDYMQKSHAEFLSDKGWLHGYLDFYDLLLHDKQETAKTILEIGVQTGASLQMWSECFPNAQIYGIDVVPPTLPLSNNIHFWYAKNAYTMELVKHIGHRFDIIIDDGPHTLDSQKFVAQHYSMLLEEKGVLCIEDVQESAWLPILADATPEKLKRWSYGVDRRAQAPDSSWQNHFIHVIDTRRIPSGEPTCTNQS